LSTIRLVLIIILGIIVLGFIFLMILKKRAESQTSLTATVDINPNGVSTVEFFSSSGYDDAQLMKLALLYAAKIRFVQSEEDPQIAEAYLGLMKEALDPSESSEHRDFLLRLSKLVQMLQAPIDAPSATGTGERFTIRLIEGKSTDFVNNDLPFRGLAANVPISVILVINAVAERLTKRSLEVFRIALTRLHEAMFNDSKPRMFEMNRAALAALEQAEAEVR
jgi:hypothetical protein